MDVVARELHKPARRNYVRRHVDIRALDETWQADLVEMIPYSRENKGYKYLLTVIDNFSKFAWAVPVKSKSAQDVTAAMESILRLGRAPKNLHTDRGKEFYNSRFQDLMKRYAINLYSTFSNMKASICERFNRTLKSKMWLQFSLKGKYEWLSILAKLLQEYNSSRHRTIGIEPVHVTSKNEKSILQRIRKTQVRYTRTPHHRNRFKVGDKVRISKYKHVFEKGYTPNWTTEIFTIRTVQRTNPVTYKLADYQDQPIEGGFYREELSKVKHPDIYLVEKIVRKSANKVLVKWLGFDNTHNSWISASDL